MEYTIRPIREGDHDAWLGLWHDYNAFYRNEPAEEVTRATFRRLVHAENGFFGLVAQDGAGNVVGMAHAIFHPATWTTGTFCYLEDLFVSRGDRGSGTGRLLIEGIYAEADRRGSDRVYWHTQQYNGAARSLYDAVAHATSFVVYKR